MTQCSPLNSVESHYRQTGEDRELTAFVSAQLDLLLSPDHDPKLPCPRCGGTEIVTNGSSKLVSGRRRPLFRCKMCSRIYSRLIGTPFENRRYLAKQHLLIPLLSQPLSFVEAGERTGSLPMHVKCWVFTFRKWLLEADPSGQWEQRVRLGGRLGELHTSALHFAEVGSQEDAVLTDRLTEAFDAINSLAVHPYPSCAFCGGADVAFTPNRFSAYPRYRCTACSRNFSRRTGTPFAKSKGKNHRLIREVIRYLSLPLSFVQVSDTLTVFDPSHIERWRDCFAAFADQLEPRGSLSSRIRLGIEPTDKTPCPHCGRAGTAFKRASAWGCTGCGRLFSMRRKVIEHDGRLQIVDGEC